MGPSGGRKGIRAALTSQEVGPFFIGSLFMSSGRVGDQEIDDELLTDREDQDEYGCGDP